MQSGFSVSTLVQRYTVSQLVQIIAYKQMKHEQNDKEDIRHASLMAMVGAVGGNKSQPKDFLINWGQQKKKQYSISQSKNTWAIFQNMQKKNK